MRELEFEGANKSFDQMYAVGREATEEQILELCAKMKEFALKGCRSEDERLAVKDLTKRNLQSWGILVEKEGKLYPTNAFVLLTNNDMLQAKVQCAVFKGTTRGEFLDRREYAGAIFEQIDEAYQFVLRNIRYGATVEGLFRVDRYEFPIGCVREIIANAMTHRSYLDPGCVQVALFDDRLEVTSPGMLFGGVTLERMKEGYSKPRNRAIANAFTYMKIVEQWGSGIPKILKECKQFGLVEPEFVEFGVDFRVNLYRKQILNGAIGVTSGTNGTIRGTNDTKFNEVKDDEGKLLSLLLENPKITQTELRTSLGISLRTIKRTMADLKEKGVLVREGTTRRGSWVVRK